MLFKKKIGLIYGILGLYLLILGALVLFVFHKISEPSFGFAVATDYQTGLAAPMTVSQSFFTVTSLTLRDGNLLSTNELGDKIFFTLEPGKTNEEIVMCTTITTSTKQISGCTRGLAFSGTSTAAVSANQKTHSPGSIVVLSNAHYVYQQFLDITGGDQTVTGTKTFVSFPKVTSTTAIPATNDELTSWYAAQTLVAGGFSSLNVSSTLGLQALSGTSNCSTSGTCVGINASTTASANGGFMNFAATTGKLYWDVVSFLAGSWTWAGTNIFNAATITSLTGTSTADNLQITTTANSGNDAANKNYVDSSISTNSATGTAGIAITAGQSLYISSTSTLFLSDADATTTSYPFVGIALTSASATQEVSYIKPGGIAGNQSGLTAGKYYYLSGTAGAISLTKGNIPVRVGIAVSATQLMVIQPSFSARTSGSQAIVSNSGTVNVTTNFIPTRIDFICGTGSVGSSVGHWMANSAGTNSQFATGNDTNTATFPWFTSTAASCKWKEGGAVYTLTSATTTSGFSMTFVDDVVGSASRQFSWVATMDDILIP